MTEDVFLVKRDDLGREWVNGSLAALEAEMEPLVRAIMSLNIGEHK